MNTVSDTVSDALRYAFRNADTKDWEWLDNNLGDSGHGRFWKAVIKEVRTALSLRPTSEARVSDAMVEKAKAELFKRGIVDTFSVRAALEAAALSIPSPKGEAVAWRPTYEQIIQLVDDCRVRRDKAGESSRMMSKWISEGLNALYAAPQPAKGVSEEMVERAIVGYCDALKGISARLAFSDLHTHDRIAMRAALEAASLSHTEKATEQSSGGEGEPVVISRAFDPHTAHLFAAPPEPPTDTLASKASETGVVKVLQWEAVTDQIPKHAFAAYTAFNRWLIVCEFLSMNHMVYRFNSVDYDTLDEAKAAAQADYEQRILSCIELPALDALTSLGKR